MSDEENINPQAPVEEYVPAIQYPGRENIISDEQPSESGNVAEAVVTCALLDADNVFVGMVEVLPSEATDRHLLQITDCDLAPGQYKWEAASGMFVSMKMRNAAIQLAAAAINENISILLKQDVNVPLDTLIWLKSITA